MPSGVNLPMDGLEPDAPERGWHLPGKRPAGRRLSDGLANPAEEPDQPDGDGPRRFAVSRRATLPAGQGQAGAESAGGGAQAAVPAVHGVALSADFVQLHYAIEALRSEDRPIVLQFVSASAGEGTSTVAAGFAAVAASERPGAVLVVSCGDPTAEVARRGTDGAPAGVPSLIEAVATGQPAAAAVWRSESCQGLLRARLGVSAHPLMEIGSGALRRLLNGLGESYATVVLDCAPATSPDSAALSRHCDGTVLVVRAGVARVAAIDKARTAVERAGGHVVGVVLNRRRRALPSWLERLL